MNKSIRFMMFVAAACALPALSACGNKGPLVLPQKPVPVEEQEIVPEPQDAPEPVDEGVDGDADGSDATHG